MKHIDLIEKFKGSTFAISFTDGETAYLHSDIISEYHLKNGIDIPDEAWTEIENANLIRKARERALYLLDYRDYSYTELFHKLEENYPEDICFEVMGKLVSIGVINDRRYAKNYARKLVEVRKLGYYRCVAEMKLKGIDKDLIDEALSEYEDTSEERLYELIVKKYSSKLGDASDADGVKKVKNALARQGYSFKDINEAISEYKDNYSQE